MHSLLLGVTKQLFDLWLSAESKDKDYYIGSKVLINVCALLNIIHIETTYNTFTAQLEKKRML